MPGKYRILIIEPAQIVRQGLSGLIESCVGFAVSCAITDLSQYSPQEDAPYDIVMINTSIVNYDQRTNIRALLDIPRPYPIVAISYAPYEDGVMYQYDGVIYIYDTREQICRKLQQALEKSSQSPLPENKELSAREKEILVALAQGKANKEIAEELNLSVYTVATHRKNISVKLGISTISGLTVYAILKK